jgi:hypothetical protein
MKKGGTKFAAGCFKTSPLGGDALILLLYLPSAGGEGVTEVDGRYGFH